MQHEYEYYIVIIILILFWNDFDFILCTWNDSMSVKVIVFALHAVCGHYGNTEPVKHLQCKHSYVAPGKGTYQNTFLFIHAAQIHVTQILT